MNRPRQYYGWEEAGKFKVSLQPRAEGGAANTYDSKEDAIRECIVRRTDGKGKPTIEWS